MNLKDTKQGRVCIWTEPTCAAGVAAGLGGSGMSPWSCAVVQGLGSVPGVFCNPRLLLQAGTWRLFHVTVGKNLEKCFHLGCMRFLQGNIKILPCSVP